MPGPAQFGGALVTNIRNTKSPHWRRWLGPESRCLVPVNSFCEWADTKPKKTPTWFALDNDRQLLAFADIWTPWRGVRGIKANPIEAITHLRLPDHDSEYRSLTGAAHDGPGIRRLVARALVGSSGAAASSLE